VVAIIFFPLLSPSTTGASSFVRGVLLFLSEDCPLSFEHGISSSELGPLLNIFFAPPRSHCGYSGSYEGFLFLPFPPVDLHGSLPIRIAGSGFSRFAALVDADGGLL